jgi:hypothetical protein
MVEKNKNEDPNIEKLLGKISDDPARDPQAQAQGRARFLAQAEALVKSRPPRPAVSTEEEVRRTGWNKNFFERILNMMKLRTRLTALAVVAVVVVVAIFVANNITTVSAQQIITRATAVQVLPTQGIWHTQIQIYQNHSMLTGDHPGTTTIDDDYLDLATGRYRSVTQDSAGRMEQVAAFDGTYNYSGLQPANNAGNNPFKVTRVKAGSDQRTKMVGSIDPAASLKALFDDFRNNPRVRVDLQKTWTDGTRVYVLVDDNYQAQKGTDGTTYTGSMRMVFNAKTYQLVESQTTVRKGGQDIVIDEVQWMVDEVLPMGSPVAWDLSDLKGVTIVDGTQPRVQANPTFETLTEQELATHTKSFYVLKSLPAGYTEKITAVADQPKDQDYQFEINYTGSNGETFGLQAVGQMDPGFVASSFYDGSYKAASGLMINYSPSHPNGGTSAMLSAPDGNSFLLISSLPRVQVQNLVETLVKGQ